MSRIFELAFEHIHPEQCAMCPRRTWASKLIATRLLGEDYVAVDCDPTKIVKDGDLKNHLFTKGVVARPFGIMTTPTYRPDSAPRINIGTRYTPHPVTSAVSINIGVSDLICPLDVPKDYNGDFEDFINITRNSTPEI